MVSLGIVIPTLNAASTIEGAISSVRTPRFETEIVVVDGGSRDGTRNVAARTEARVVECAPGRGGQLAAGARAVSGDWLLFMHADSRPDAGWAEAVDRFSREPGNVRRAAAFRLAFDTAARPAGRVARLANWRSRHLGLPYGDQGLLISRSFYEEVGGYREIPLMEDVDLVRRIGRRRIEILPVAMMTGAERYLRDGWIVRPLLNLMCLALFSAGVPPHRIAPLYGGRWVPGRRR